MKINPQLLRQLAQASAAAYEMKFGGNPIPYLNAAGLEVEVSLKDMDGTVRGFIGKASSHRVLAIKGTASLKDFFTDLRLLKKKIGETKLTRFRSTFVHEGFLAEQEIMMKRLINDGLQLGVKDRLPLYLTGHSLGGAVATILAVSLKNIYPSLDIAVATFGSPRVGDPGFVKAFNGLIHRSVRVVHHVDLVPRIPKLGYDHVDHLLHLTDDGKVIGRIHSFFKHLFELGEILIDDLDGEALQNHHIDTYIRALMMYQLDRWGHSQKQ